MLIDLLIVFVGIIACIRGKDIGFIRQVCATVGFFGGLFLGAALQPYTVSLVHSTTNKGAVTVLTTLGTALIFLTAAEYGGLVLKHHIIIGKKINVYDNAFGSVLGVISILFSVWLGSSILKSYPSAAVQTALNDSAIITLLDRELPGAPALIASLGRLVDPNGFPQVFIGSEPIPRGDINLPSLGELGAAVNRDKDSIVKVAGEGCGGIVEGSGFVVGTNLVATNAHVVAGIRHPFVQDVNGNHSAQVVSFDPNLDFAVLRVSNLAGPPLTIATEPASEGTAAAVVGYPGGGDFKASPAAVLDSYKANGRNIYGRGSTTREVYELRADVIPGNSGGPLIDTSGLVIGVIFAESTSYEHVGYALTPPAVLKQIASAERQTAAVSNGRCAE